MATLFAVLEIGIAACVLIAICNSFMVDRASHRWWYLLGLTAVVGGVVGVWIAFNVSYHPSSGVLVFSFPVPAGFLVLEHYDDGSQAWVDFATPTPMFIAAANACLLFAIPICFVWLARSILARQSFTGLPADRQ